MSDDSPTTEIRESSDTLMPTTDTMRKKAKFVAKCAVYIMKLWRCIKCNKSTKADKKPQNNA